MKVVEFLKKWLSKKWVLAILAIVIVIIIIKVAAYNKRSASGIVNVPVETQENLSDYELEQRHLNEMFGEPPAGFVWNANGDLVALGDSTKTPEDVAYAYLKSLSQLEFATASKYASYAQIPSNYNSMYQNSSASSISQFTRNLYKEVLLSIEVDGVKDVAIFEDGRYIITFSASLIDLTDKEFWLKDMETIYANLYSYSSGEGDTSKANQYLYDYLLAYYSGDNVKKRTTTFDLVLDKTSAGSWLVSDDSTLDALCRYQNGAVVSDYIWQCYTQWVNENKR